MVTIDGATGEALWETEDIVAMITIARFGGLNGDGTPDLLGNGRGTP